MVKTKDDYFEKLLKKFLPKFQKAIETEIQLGQKIVIENAKDQGSNTQDSGLLFSKKDLNVWTDKLELFVKDFNREISKQINNLVLTNISNKGSTKDLADNLKELFADKKEDYKKRYETIARDQSSEILNTSGWNKAQKLGAKTKWCSTIFDSRRCPICDASQKKYGDESKAIPVSENFVVFAKGKEFVSVLAKFHVKCRCLTLYGFE